MPHRTVAHLIAHAWQENDFSAVGEHGLEFAGQAEEDVPLLAPMVGNVSGRILHPTDPDIAEVTCAPQCHAGFTRVLGRLDGVPLGNTKWYVGQDHLRTVRV